MFLDILIHFTSLILFLNTGANDVLISCATSIGSRSLHRRIVICLILLSSIITYYKLKNGHVPLSSWINTVNYRLHNDPDRLREVLAAAVISSTVFTVMSIVSKFPLPLDASFCAFFYGYLIDLAPNDATTTLTRQLVLSYLILPTISGCFTWCIYRILIRGILFADPEEKFKRTLSWCGVIYPVAISTSFAVIALKYYLSHHSALLKFIYGHVILVVSFGLAYALFKVFLRAWIKRRVFLMYPQEYAVYMERSEKVEQSDREARGLGPIQDYYLPPKTGININLTKSSQSIKDTNSTILQPTAPAISPAVIAGKLAIISKRSEELFRPILNLLSMVTLFTLTSFESRNVLIIAHRALDSTKESLVPTPLLLWSAFLFILSGGLLLSRRYAVFLGRNIINDMKFSQAFAIQLGTLLTITLGLFLHSIPLAPMWYLLFSIAAVCSSQEVTDTDRYAYYYDVDDDDESVVTFRQKLGSVIFLWTCSIGFSGAVGFMFRMWHESQSNYEQ